MNLPINSFYLVNFTFYKQIILAGIYIHIPFCKQACHYCDFHFSTNHKYVDEMTAAICMELKLQKDYLTQEPINTIYFGGGTPSLLSSSQLSDMLTIIRSEYQVTDHAEVTLEANPDDLDRQKLQMLFDAGVNRLSIGIQSFHEKTLQFLNRAHDRKQALQCLEDARAVGFNNISIDLIYGIPSENHQLWQEDLAQAIKLQPEHISSYCLTIEPKTTFGNWLKKGNIPPVEEEYAADQFEILIDELSKAGYEQYEVSNFCKPGFYSRHNSSYWKQNKYLGIGPSAHSYNGQTRQFNVSHNPKYMKALADKIIPYELDVLTKADKVNEYLLTTLRTTWGANLKRIKNEWQYDLELNEKNYLHQLFEKKYAIIEDNHLKLTRSGLLLADKISADLFVD